MSLRLKAAILGGLILLGYLTLATFSVQVTQSLGQAPAKVFDGPMLALSHARLAQLDVARLAEAAKRGGELQDFIESAADNLSLVMERVEDQDLITLTQTVIDRINGLSMSDMPQEEINELLGEIDIVAESVAAEGFMIQLEMEEMVVSGLSRTVYIAIGSFIVLLASGTVFYLSMMRPFGLITDALRRLARGDALDEIYGESRKDEIGELAQAIGRFRDAAERMRQAELDRAKAEKAASEAAEEMRESQRLAEKELLERQKQQSDEQRQQIKDQLHSLANDLHAIVQEVLGDVNRSTDEMKEQVACMVMDGHKLCEAADHMTDGTGTIKNNASATSDILEEFKVSFNHLGDQMDRTRFLMSETSQAAGQLERASASLIETVSQVSDALGVIEVIAGGTRMLALNATIESARAGEAGKGFAVVAQEVQALAGRSTEITEQIKGTVEEIRAVVAESVEAVSKVKGAIDGVDQASSEASDILGDKRQMVDRMIESGASTAAGCMDVFERSGAICDLSKKSLDLSEATTKQAEEISHHLKALQEKLEAATLNASATI